MPAKPRRSISRATSSVARRRPGTATRLTAGSCWGMRVSFFSLSAPAPVGRKSRQAHCAEQEQHRRNAASPFAPYTFSCALHLLELLQRADEARHRLVGEARFPVGVGHLADIDVAARIAGEAVRRDEFA